MKEKIIELKGMDYTVREDGKIFGNHTCGRGKAGRELKQRLNSDGYYCVTVGVNGKRTVMRVHRIIALAFIENPLNLPEVDHIDNDRTNNHVSNLEWLTHKDNCNTVLTRKNISNGQKNKWKKLRNTNTNYTQKHYRLLDVVIDGVTYKTTDEAMEALNHCRKWVIKHATSYRRGSM